MNTKDKVGFILLRFLVWAIGTLVYRVAGSYFFEGFAVGYWVNTIFTGILCATVCLAFMKWLRIERKYWLQSVICIALPGMMGEIPILACFSDIMSNMQPETAGWYGAFLFACYSLPIVALHKCGMN
ncbi:MAG: DUF5367 family protein [Richelia sp.]|nr:DUF5367 family protein [Richelia sp.]